MSSGLNTKNELLAIFPQHNEATINRIYRSVVETLGQNDSHVLVLPNCIERLLELPSNNINEHNVGNTNFNRPQPVPNPFLQNNKRNSENTLFDNIPGLDESDQSDNSYDSPSSDDEIDNDNDIDDYRNRPRPTYRERHSNGSPSPNRSRSLSPPNDDRDSYYFSDRDDTIFAELDDDLSELEGLETSATANPIEGLETSATANPIENVITIQDSPVMNRKRKLDDSHGKLKTDPVDLTNSQNDNNGTPIKKLVLTDDINGISNIIFTPKNEPKQPDLSAICYGMVGYLDLSVKEIKAVIGDVDNMYLETLVNSYFDVPVSIVVQRVIENLLDNPSYPKVVKTLPVASTSQKPSSSSTITSSMNNFLYKQQAIILLQNSFPKVSTRVLRKAFSDSTNKYTKAFDIIEGELKSISSGEKKAEETIIVSFMKGKRNTIKISELCPALADEIKAMEERRKEEIEKGDRETASALNSEQYDEEGQFIECGCCYNEVAFDDMIQCLDGHLFCTTCLQSYSKEAVYGSGKAQLFCMTDGCDSTFPLSQMKKGLQGDLLEKYMERVQDEDIKLANLSNLIRCPNCDFAAEMDDGDKVFRCQNTSCMKETCRYCQEEWKDHFGIPCKELEKKEAKNLRTSYEEKMTEAKVRKCWQCSTIFLKSDGCNKMTCRCGAKMCYICRKPKIDYSHFCQHPRDPGKQCTKCKNCNLWTDPSEDDDRAVAEIKKQAEEEGKKLEENGDSKISIGPTISIPASSTYPKPFLQRAPLLIRHPQPRHVNRHGQFQHHVYDGRQEQLIQLLQLQQMQQLQRQRFQGNW